MSIQQEVKRIRKALQRQFRPAKVRRGVVFESGFLVGYDEKKRVILVFYTPNPTREALLAYERALRKAVTYRIEVHEDPCGFKPVPHLHIYLG